MPRLALRRGRARHQRAGQHQPGTGGEREMKRAWGIGLAAAGIAAAIAMAWTLNVQAQGGATTGAPPRMPPAPAKSSYTPVVEEPFEVVFKRMSAAKDGVMKRQLDLLARALRPGRPPRAGRHDDRAASRCRPACGSSCRAGATLGRPGRDGPRRDPRQGSLPGRVPARCPTPTTPRAGWSSRSSTSTRSSKQTGRDLDALRSRLRPARPLPARVPAADLPHHAARPGRRLAGQAGHDRQLLRAVQRHPEPQAARRAAAAA